MSDAVASANIARHLPLMAAAQPATAALKVPRGRNRDGRIDYLTLSFAELETEVAAWQEKLTRAGVRRGDRTLVMVRQGLPLIAAVFALFGLGAVPVVIDPGMGRQAFLAAVARSRPRVLLGIPLAQILSRVFRAAFRTVEVRVGASGRTTARLARPGGPDRCTVVAGAADELAAILFTSGSTGAPKGVSYAHGMFAAQVDMIRATYAITPGEVDLPMLPIFALFNPALGMTTVVPEIDPSRPARVDPAKIVQAITQEGVTNSFGSPTLWGKIADHCVAHDLTLPTLRRVLCAGAPVPPALWERLPPRLPAGRLHSPYGATEALPVASVSSDELQGDLAGAARAGRGTCVGRVIAPNTVRIIALTDEALAELAAARVLPAGEIGEIIVRGPSVTRGYDALPEATARAKIADPAGGVWHRLGDCGYLDAAGRLWFCGRAAERVVGARHTWFTEQVEPIFNAHPAVRRTALVALGEPGCARPALAVEPRDRAMIKRSAACRALGRELRALGRACPTTVAIRTFYFHPGFPVDVRHNAKIHRLALAAWAHTAVGFDIDPKR
jgi:olefin beta-lactone synthetase